MPEMTTAALLGKFYKELTENGIDADLATDIVRDAARSLILNDGIGVAE